VKMSRQYMFPWGFYCEDVTSIYVSMGLKWLWLVCEAEVRVDWTTAAWGVSIGEDSCLLLILYDLYSLPTKINLEGQNTYHIIVSIVEWCGKTFQSSNEE
jgi:hypothetical protein